MYETLFEIILWFIFVRRKCKVRSLKENFLKWSLLLVFLNVQSNFPLSSAFVFALENNTSMDGKIESIKFPEGTAYKGSENFSDLFSNSNSTSINDVNSQQQELTIYRHSLFVSAIYIVAYSVVFVIGLVGNCVVMIVVIRSSRMRNATNFFICNLAFADTLVIVFCLPATLLGHLLTPWILGFVLCKLVSYLQGVAVSASINTLVAVSIERYLAICFPFKRPMGRRQARKWIFFIWALSLSIAMPWAFFFKTIPYNQQFSNNQSILHTNASDEFETNPSEQLFALNNGMSNKADIQHIEKNGNQLKDHSDDNRFSNEMNKQNKSLSSNQINIQINGEIDGTEPKKFLNKRTLKTSSIEHWKTKRMIELSVLNAIYRRIWQKKICLLYRKMNINSKNMNLMKIDKNNVAFLSEILELPVSYTKNLMKNNMCENFTQNLSELDQLIKRLSLMTCKCFGVDELSCKKNQRKIDRKFGIQKFISKYLNLLFENSSQPKLNNDQQDEKSNSSIVLTKLFSYNKILRQLNNLKASLYEQIESSKKNSSFKRLGCELDKFMCTLFCPFFDQLISAKQKITHQLNSQSNNEIRKQFSRTRLERSINVDFNQESKKELKENTRPENFDVTDTDDDFDDSNKFYNYETCTEQWPNPILEKTYFIIANLILCYLFPLIIISACYVAIYFTVWTRRVPCDTNVTNNTPTLEMPHHSCRISFEKKQNDRQSTASSSRSTRSLLINSFSGLKNSLFSTAQSKQTSTKNLAHNQKNVYENKMPKNDRPLRNQSLIFKSRNSQGDCQLNDKEKIDSTVNCPTYSPNTSENHKKVKDQLINNKKCCNSINESKTTIEMTKPNQFKESIVVCSVQNQGNISNQSFSNATQQIMITIDPISNTNSANNSLKMNRSPSLNVYKRLRNQLKIFRQFFQKKKLTENKKAANIEGNESEKSISMKSDSQPRSSQDDGNDSKKLIECDLQIDSDYEVELDDSKKQDEKQNSNHQPSKSDLIQCFEQKEQKHQDSKTDSEKWVNQPENGNQINKLIAKRTLSKQMIYAPCRKFSNFNNCESRPHNAKQLIKSTKSTPITGTDRLCVQTNQCRIRKSSKNSNPRQFRLEEHLDTSAQLNNRIEVLIKNSRYKVAKMMIVIILVFFVCWLPLYIIFTKLKLGLQFTRFTQLEEKITFLLTPFAQWICYINSCINPILYAFLNKKYRAEFQKLFSNVRCFHFGKTHKKTTNRKSKHNTSTIFKASIKNQASVNVNYEQNSIEQNIVDKIRDETFKNNCPENCEKSNKETSFKLLSNKLPDDFRLPRQQTSIKKNQHRKASINRSLSDTNLLNRTSFKRLSFSA